MPLVEKTFGAVESWRNLKDPALGLVSKAVVTGQRNSRPGVKIVCDLAQVGCFSEIDCAPATIGATFNLVTGREAG
jgi:hypothetical protein